MTRSALASPKVGEISAARCVAGALALTLALSPVAAAAPPLAVLAGVAAVGLATAVSLHPPLAAYVLLASTPLLAGIERGALVPVLRPQEAIGLLVGAGLLARALVRLVQGSISWPRLRAVDVAILLMAWTSSVMPLLWMVARGLSPSADDVFYALTLWKYYGVYLLVRISLRTEDDVRRALWVTLASATVVALFAMLESLGLLGVPGLLDRFYAAEDSAGSLRGGSTLTSPIAVAGFLSYNLAIALAWLLRQRRHRPLLIAAAVLFLLGTVSSGQFSGVLALSIVVVAVGWVTGRISHLVVVLLASAPFVGIILRPVIAERLSGFSSPSGLPQSWVVRLDNLRTYFWPELFSNYNFLFGVRPEARVTAAERGHVWIESGHIWLLWTGGIPFAITFLLFLWVAISTTLGIARRCGGVVGVAGVASFASLCVMALLMTLDPHLTMRGVGDLLFSLLGMASAGYTAKAMAGQAGTR